MASLTRVDLVQVGVPDRLYDTLVNGWPVRYRQPGGPTCKAADSGRDRDVAEAYLTLIARFHHLHPEASSQATVALPQKAKMLPIWLRMT